MEFWRRFSSTSHLKKNMLFLYSLTLFSYKYFVFGPRLVCVWISIIYFVFFFILKASNLKDWNEKSGRGVIFLNFENRALSCQKIHKKKSLRSKSLNAWMEKRLTHWTWQQNHLTSKPKFKQTISFLIPFNPFWKIFTPPEIRRACSHRPPLLSTATNIISTTIIRNKDMIRRPIKWDRNLKKRLPRNPSAEAERRWARTRKWW